MVAMMTSDQVNRARAYVVERGRPLERVRLAEFFGEAEPGEVAQALRAYGNDDGGVGNAVESDCRAPQSSALGALTALDVARMHAVPQDDEFVVGVCDWLVRTVSTDDGGRAVWPFLPPEAEESAHAPWWDQQPPGRLADTFNGFVANPGVALTAHLWRHEAVAPGRVPADLLDRLGRQAVQIAELGVSPEEVNAHDALAHLAGEPAVPASVREPVLGYLGRVLPDRVMATDADYATYAVHPLWVAPTPDHPLAPLLAEQITRALDRTAADQEDDGSWAPFWSWADRDPAAWAIAEPEWRGTLVVRNLQALRAYGRVDLSGRS